LVRSQEPNAAHAAKDECECRCNASEEEPSVAPARMLDSVLDAPLPNQIKLNQVKFAPLPNRIKLNQVKFAPQDESNQF